MILRWARQALNTTAFDVMRRTQSKRGKVPSSCVAGASALLVTRCTLDRTALCGGTAAHRQCHVAGPEAVDCTVAC